MTVSLHEMAGRLDLQPLGGSVPIQNKSSGRVVLCHAIWAGGQLRCHRQKNPTRTTTIEANELHRWEFVGE